eukprot:CAMPEP_0114609838 /NCGR_PEP_ID=MMETSP0168-20121206/3291_1 /TAXON_ID=95228 ORGANISM="Vannella sp., Strain DIVA3 517/6/12" /NCGR_SAMPLE_ID=MMETSP0168 /ASSEMBLY_ACC=CAM_ASM_000044 /LENGTH=292 /DNA_ID=CAMNT_0001820761 /DNA_START=149 /DNA_END=1024 /DNA_ORIENTATION=-
MGLEEVSHSDDHVEVIAGESILRFDRRQRGTGALHTADEVGHMHYAFNIAPNLFDEAFAWLEKNLEVLGCAWPGFNTDKFHFEGWDARAMYFYDADKNVAEFITRHTLPKSCERTFGEEGFVPRDGILNISEVMMASGADTEPAVVELQRALRVPRYIGKAGGKHRPIPESDVPEPAAGAGAGVRSAWLHSLAWLRRATSWRIFSLLAAKAGFQPLGDERGLLILASDGRPLFGWTDLQPREICVELGPSDDVCVPSCSGEASLAIDAPSVSPTMLNTAGVHEVTSRERDTP